MRNQIFPRQFDGTFQGPKLAAWLLVPVVFVRAAMGANSLVDARVVATTADGIPLERFGGGGAETVVAFFAVWGLGQVLFALLGVLALVRYRSMIPFAYLVLLVEHLGRKAVFAAYPIARSGADGAGGWPSAGALVAWALLAATVVGFVLSLVRRDRKQAA